MLYVQYAFRNCPMAELINLSPKADKIVPYFGGLFPDEPLPKVNPPAIILCCCAHAKQDRPTAWALSCSNVCVHESRFRQSCYQCSTGSCFRMRDQCQRSNPISHLVFLDFPSIGASFFARMVSLICQTALALA